MPSGGVYVVEDLHTSYWTPFGGGVPAPPSTAIGLAKDAVDAVQAEDPTYVRQPDWGPAPPTPFAHAASLHVYGGIFFVTRA